MTAIFRQAIRQHAPGRSAPHYQIIKFLRRHRVGIYTRIGDIADLDNEVNAWPDYIKVMAECALSPTLVGVMMRGETGVCGFVRSIPATFEPHLAGLL